VGQFGIRVHLIQPGYVVDTPFFETRPLVGASAGDESSPYAGFVRERQQGRGSLIPTSTDTTPNRAAQVILEAIEKGDDFRYPVGPDAEKILALRNSTDDRTFDLLLRKDLRLTW
jgi:hypothetical protein